MPSGDSLSAPPEDLRPRTKHTRFGGVDVRPYRFTAPGYSEPRTSGHYWCSPLSSYVMSSITQFVPTRLVVGDIAEATLVATSTALGLLASTTGGGGDPLLLLTFPVVVVAVGMVRSVLTRFLRHKYLMLRSLFFQLVVDLLMVTSSRLI